MVDISGLDKEDVLIALYNNSKVQGMGGFQRISELLTRDHATELLNHGTYFDYLYGKIMKVDLSDNEFDPWLYDRDNGNGAALRAIEDIKFRNELAKEE